MVWGDDQEENPWIERNDERLQEIIADEEEGVLVSDWDDDEDEGAELLDGLDDDEDDDEAVVHRSYTLDAFDDEDEGE